MPIRQDVPDPVLLMLRMSKLNAHSSQTIDFMRFPLIVGIVMIHCHIESDSLPAATCFINLFHIGFCRPCVPLFFIISGFLFFRNGTSDRTTYISQLRKRVPTVLVPYLLWNILALIWYVMVSRGAIVAKIPTDNIFKFLQYIFWDQLGEPCSFYYEPPTTPVDYPLWYLRDLIVMSIISPLFYVLLKGRKGIWVLGALLVCFVAGLGPHISGLEPGAVVFFGFGAYSGIHGLDPVEACGRPTVFRATAATAIWTALCVASVSGPTAFIRERCIGLGILCGVYALTCWASYMTDRRARIPALLTSSTFFVFGLHSLVIGPWRSILSKVIIPDTSVGMILLYFSLSATVTAFCVASYWLLRRICPPIAKALTGGR